MGVFEAITVILQAVREAGGFVKFAEFLTRNREEVLRMQKELPKPGHSKGY